MIRTLTEGVTAYSCEYGVPHSELRLFVLDVLEGKKVQLLIVVLLCPSCSTRSVGGWDYPWPRHLSLGQVG